MKTRLIHTLALIPAMFLPALAGCGGGGTTDGGTTDVQTTDTGGSTDGGTVSGGCMTYCTQITTNCTGDNAQYTDMADCLAYCASAGWPAGTDGDQSGNTLACRTYHSGGPATMNATLHCPHAGPTGAGVCGSLTFRTDLPAMYTRVDRMGMPAVSTALVSTAQKNAYNDGDPANDSTFAPEFINTLTALHGALDDDFTALNLTPCSMTTLVGGLPECLGQTYAANHTVASLVVPNDVITLDPSVAAGFPNGRLLADPVIDVTLAVLFLKLGTGTCGTGAAAGPCSALTLASLPLNPPHNDVAGGMFLTTFPYLQPVHAP